MKKLVLDIETIANPDMIKILPEVKPKTNLVKAEAIEKDIADKKQKQIDSMNLSPYYGQVCCIGLKEDDTDAFSSIRPEKELLVELQKEMSTLPQIITFNGFEFDIPFLHFRYLFHGLKSPFTQEYFKRYNTDAHYDIFMVLTAWRGFTSSNSINMNTLGKVFGFEVEEGFSGADVQKAWDNGEHDKIKEHCRKDIILTDQIYNRMTGGN